MSDQQKMLEINEIHVSYGSLSVLEGLTWQVAASGITALLGPSGCGKSTLLRAIAGLEPLTAGTIHFGERELTRIAAHRRDFGVVFQDGQLFSGRSVAANIAYGLKVRGWGRREITERVTQMLELVRLPDIGDRRVDDLSGGQAQRVALARALAPRPSLLLLDEPLAALDSELREQLSIEIREVVRAAGIPALMVTHDRDEAARVADVIAVMNAGRIEQQARPHVLWRAPATEWAAQFLGSVVIDAQVVAGMVECEVGRMPLAALRDAVSQEQHPRGMRLGLRPESLLVSALNGASTGAAEGFGVQATVRSCVALPGQVRVRVALASGSEYDAIATTMLPVESSVVVTPDPAKVAIVG